MAWCWKSKGGVSEQKPAKLSYDQIERLRKLGDDYIKFMSAGQRVAGAVPSKLLNSASLNEIRAGVYEHLMVLLQVGLTFPQQIEIMEATTTMFLAMKYFETSFAKGQREVESEESYNKSLEFWDLFQNLIIRDEGRRFEINEEEIRGKIVCKLIRETK